MLDPSPGQFLTIFRIFLLDFLSFYVVNRLRSEICFFPPVTISSKKSQKNRHTDLPASFTVLTTLRYTAAISAPASFHSVV